MVNSRTHTHLVNMMRCENIILFCLLFFFMNNFLVSCLSFIQRINKVTATTATNIQHAIANAKHFQNIGRKEMFVSSCAFGSPNTTTTTTTTNNTKINNKLRIWIERGGIFWYMAGWAKSIYSSMMNATQRKSTKTNISRNIPMTITITIITWFSMANQFAGLVKLRWDNIWS